MPSYAWAVVGIIFVLAVGFLFTHLMVSHRIEMNRRRELHDQIVRAARTERVPKVVEGRVQRELSPLYQGPMPGGPGLQVGEGVPLRTVGKTYDPDRPADPIEPIRAFSDTKQGDFDEKTLGNE